MKRAGGKDGDEAEEENGVLELGVDVVGRPTPCKGDVGR